MSNEWIGGKGDRRRNPNDKAYADNWEKIFGKKKPVVKERKKTPSMDPLKFTSTRQSTIERKR